jgi:hypothetical protein
MVYTKKVSWTDHFRASFVWKTLMFKGYLGVVLISKQAVGGYVILNPGTEHEHLKYMVKNFQSTEKKKLHSL